MNLGAKVPDAFQALRRECDLGRLEFTFPVMGPDPRGEKDWLRECDAAMTGGDMGDEKMADRGRRAAPAGDEETESLSTVLLRRYTLEALWPSPDMLRVVC